jgi:hypothetical protein
MSATIFLNMGGSQLAAAISAREYNRMLQMPRDRELDGELLARADGAKRWYAEHGRPFVAARRVAVQLSGERDVDVQEGNLTLSSIALARRLRSGDAHALVLLAASAGPEAHDEVARLWKEGLPDEAFFLDRFAVTVTERLVSLSSATLCRAAEPAQETLMPHLSPGCGTWDISEQHKVWSLLAGPSSDLGPMRMLESGGMYPQHSVLAAMGVTHQNFDTSPDFKCRCCDLTPCAFRRAPYQELL